jgi:hypothetical protein
MAFFLVISLDAGLDFIGMRLLPETIGRELD